MSKEHPTTNERHESLTLSIRNVKEIRTTIRKNFLAKGVKSPVYERLDRTLARKCMKHIAYIDHILHHIDDLVYEEREQRKEVING